MWRFYKSIIKEAPRLFTRGRGLLSSIVTTVLFFAALFNRSWLGSLQESWAGVSPWWSLAVVGIYVVYGLLRINHEKFASLEQVTENRQKTIAQLRDQLEPKLRITFSQGRSFEQIDQVDVTEIQRLYRISIVNEGGMTVENVRVQLESIEGCSNPFLPIELHQMHDSADPPSRSFSLNPGQIQHIDVVAMRERGRDSDSEILLWYAVRGVPNSIPRGNYRLGIVAVGDDVQPTRRRFWVSVDEGRLVFREEI